MNPIEALKAAVEAEDKVIESAIILISGISQRLADGIAAARAGDLADLEALQADITAHTASLGAAVAANTPGSNP